MLELTNLTTEALLKLKIEIESELANRNSNKVLFLDDATNHLFYANSLEEVCGKIHEMCAEYLMTGVLHLDDYIVKLDPKYNPPAYYGSLGWPLESGGVRFKPNIACEVMYGVPAYRISVESPIRFSM